MIKNKLTNRQKALPRFLLNTVRGMSVERAANWFKYDRNVLKNIGRNFVPPVLVATITDACNLRCPTCLYLLENKKYLSKNFMPFADFVKVLDKYADKAEILFLSGGEPLLHPEFWRFAATGKDYGLKVKTSINGIGITNDVLSKWSLKYRLDDINVSADCWSLDSFKKYRGGNADQYIKVLDGLSYLSDVGSDFSISFLLSRENVRYVNEMVSFASLYDPTTIHFHNINPHGCSNFRPLVTSCEEMDYIEKNLINKTTYNSDIVISHIFNEESGEFYTKGCVQPWYYLCWDYRGDIAPCCHLAHDASYGNVLSTGESDRMKVFRKMQMTNSACKDTVNLPQSCRHCHRRFLGKNYASFDRKKGRWNK